MNSRLRGAPALLLCKRRLQGKETDAFSDQLACTYTYNMYMYNHIYTYMHTYMNSRLRGAPALLLCERGICITIYIRIFIHI